MSYNFVLNASNNVSIYNNTFKYNFINGQFDIPEGSVMCINTLVLPYSWYNVSSFIGNNTFYWTYPVPTASFTINATSSSTITVSAISGTLNLGVGSIITCSSNPTSTSPNGLIYITALGTGTGNGGTYTVSQYYGTTTIIPGANLIGSMVFSGCQINADFKGRSYSYNTAVNGPSSSILGYAQRDIQTSQSKSNTLSTFYCQMPPRCMGRPSNNFLQIQIFNNAFFAGGITAYSGSTVSTYSTTATNGNYLTDTDQLGTQINSTNDMTAYNLYLEFVPIETSRRKSRFDDA